jgi:hypothetical protein
MGTLGIIGLLSKASSKLKDGGWTLLQRPPSVWSSSKSILDKVVQVQHPEGPRLLIVNSCVSHTPSGKEEKMHMTSCFIFIT